MKEVKTDIASSIQKQDDKMAEQGKTLSDKVESIQSDLTTQGELVKQLHSEVGNLKAMAIEQQRQINETL